MLGKVASMTRRSRTGGIIAKLLVTLLIGLTLCLLAAFYIAQNVHVTARDSVHGGSLHIETPAGSMQVHENGFPPESVGIPVYPGAVRMGKGAPAFEFESEGNAFSYVVAEYETPDSLGEVRQFYRQRSPHWIFSNEEDRETRAEYSSQGYKRIIVLHRENGRTHIVLASTGEAAAN